jgi:hypothetical protein
MVKGEGTNMMGHDATGHRSEDATVKEQAELLILRMNHKFFSEIIASVVLKDNYTIALDEENKKIKIQFTRRATVGDEEIGTDEAETDAFVTAVSAFLGIDMLEFDYVDGGTSLDEQPIIIFNGTNYSVMGKVGEIEERFRAELTCLQEKARDPSSPINPCPTWLVEASSQQLAPMRPRSPV